MTQSVIMLYVWQIVWDFDQLIFKFIHRGNHFLGLDHFMVALTTTGLGHVQLLIFAILYKCLPQHRSHLITIVSYGVFAGLLRLPIMLWIQRERPSNFNFSVPLEHVYGSSSFPSGHATTSFAIAFSTWFLTRNTKYAWIGYMMIFWSIGLGYSRCYVGVHYPSDILGAALFALICNHFWTFLMIKNRWFLYKKYQNV